LKKPSPRRDAGWNEVNRVTGSGSILFFFTFLRKKYEEKKTGL
jgi:hypothetical protein